MVLETNITKMFGIKHPIVAAPMGPFYTTELTVAVSEAGGLGVLSHTNMFGKSSLSEMKKNMEYVVEHTDKPFGFNVRTSRLQVDAPSLCRAIPRFIRDNPKLREQCVYVVTSAGTPKMIQNNSFQKLKDEGSQIKHFHVAPSLWLAGKCQTAGVDGMVVTGWEGGGHQSYEKISTLVLLQQVRKNFPDAPLIACGGFATGEGLAAALAMGAGGIAMGSRFIASKESEFHENYKNIVPPAKAQDTIYVTGVLGPIRLWKNNYSLHHGVVSSKDEKLAEETMLTPERALEDQKHYEMVYGGDITDGAVLLGQSIGIINSIETVRDILDDIIKGAEKNLANAAKFIK
ncbi:MAG: nitronate monooxygenase family protein [Candidatus Lokiarchaeota archaeon]|nr:nitronate monooxygenase family protein [Candidatus Lokiarchaeota archaeon]